MNLDLTWRLARLHQLIHRAWGSVALRGWKGTFRRITEALRAPELDDSAGHVLMPTWEATTSGQRRLLVIDTKAPNPIRDSGSLRLCMMLQLLHQDGWHVDLLSDDSRVTAATVARLGEYGIRAYDGSAMQWLRQYGSTLDAVLLCRLSVAAQFLAQARRWAPQAMCIFDTVDLHFLREQRAAEVSGSRRMRRQADASRRQELDLIRRSDLSFVVSQIELALLREALPESNVELLSNIHELHGRCAPFAERQDLLFVGGFGHPPNDDAMRWFVSDILPLLLERDPALRLHIVGDITPEARRALERPNVMIHGRVEDLSALMNQCKVSIAPLRFGAGVKGKVNMAMSYGLPVIATSIAAEGMHTVDGADVLIADTAASFAEATWRACTDESLWMQLSEGGLANIRTHFSPELARNTLRKALPASIRSDNAASTSTPGQP